MKKFFALVAVALLSITAVSAQNKSWAEAKRFHHFMSTSFHPAEEGNFKPLREKADSLYLAAVAWQASPVPADYKEKETKETLDKLVTETKAIAEAVKNNAADADLLKMITGAHDTFHHIVGECRKDDEGEHKGEGHKEGNHKEGKHK